jgi:hypothetical protein
MVERRSERKDAVERDEPEGGLKADDAAAGGRYADRPSRVGSKCNIG